MPTARSTSKRAEGTKPRFFRTPSELREWLERNHETAAELLVGFYKRGTGKPSITWPESVDQALCFGWIDGVRRSLGDESYAIRFTPRRGRSVWSAVNVRRVQNLIAAGLMHPRGLAAFAAREQSRTQLYSYERSHQELDAAYAKEFRANDAAWRWYQAQAPWYRRTTTHWVMSAKQEETRRRRLATLIADCAKGRYIAAVPKSRPRQAHARRTGDA